jgi:hypothetical protein
MMTILHQPRYSATHTRWIALFLAFCPVLLIAAPASKIPANPVQWSGIYPHLAFFNDENECGSGALVAWADRLWAVTYAPHAPRGSTDKLYEITPELELIPRPESVGGTPANRMIHRESKQLFIGPYAIDVRGGVRVIPYDKMYGRPTGNARHLTDPVHKIYYATMEEGIYEVDVQTLAVKELFRDEQLPGGRKASLPGYHGKGLYSGQGRLIYANNGEHGDQARQRPETPSGVLAQWDGKSDAWEIVRRNQFTEVTGPGGIHGNDNPGSDPIWTVGWDHRSLILMVLDKQQWHAYRLPKASHSYDGAHGWNTEWPRIRDIGEKDLLMTMHGMLWRFPRNFAPGRTGGLAPRSSYLKVVGDFCLWQDRVVFGCDDTARNEFLNKRQAKGTIAAPQSQSNLWFVPPDQLDHLGPVQAQGAAWLGEDIPTQTSSDPFLVSGFKKQAVHLSHEGNTRATFTMEIDQKGDGHWESNDSFLVEPNGYRWVPMTTSATWIRFTSTRPITKATAWFHLSNPDHRPAQARTIFRGLAGPEDAQVTGGLVRARGGQKRSLHFAALQSSPQGPTDLGYYELGPDMKLRHVEDPTAHHWLKLNAAVPAGILQHDKASALFIDDEGRRFRLPRSSPDFKNTGSLGPERVAREISTERDLFNCYGTFYELPAENAGGFAKVRPIATHQQRIKDFCSYRGLLVLSGVSSSLPRENPHIIPSDDGRTALWVGAADDLWKLGKPVGTGGPWNQHQIHENETSDPYLMTGFDRKTLTLESSRPTVIHMEIDLDGTGLWKRFRSFTMKKNQSIQYKFPQAFQAYWVRFQSTAPSTITAQLNYE